MRGIRQGAQVHKAHRIRERFAHGVRDGHGDCCLSHASRADDREESMCNQVAGDGATRLVAPDHPGEQRWQRTHFEGGTFAGAGANWRGCGF
jgi:hypothetical protein